jgi:PRTRC genetic system ThiF family protein
MKHYLSSEILSSSDRINVLLAGCGGTGSKVLTRLCALNHALEQFDHPGLNIVAFDSDTVSRANIARQDFALADLDMPKSSVLITRANRYYGHGWNGFPCHLDTETFQLFSKVSTRGRSILITCVDSAKARKEIFEIVSQQDNSTHAFGVSSEKFDYWLDFGNSKETGQVVLGTFRPIEQPETLDSDCSSLLPTILDLFPDLLSFDDTDDTPSCSLPEALKKQSLFINSIVSDYGSHLLSCLFLKGVIEQHGVFVNLANFQTSPIPVDPEFWSRQGWKVAA